MMERRGATTFSAKSSSTAGETVFDARLKRIMGWLFGLFLRDDGGAGIPPGMRGIADAMAVCTSTAALSIERSRSKMSVMLVLPRPLFDTIELRPAMVVN